MQNCQASEAVDSEEHKVVSEQAKMMWLGQSHLLLWVAGELPYLIQARDSFLFQLRECVKIISGRFMLFVLCHYRAFLLKQGIINLVVPLVLVGSAKI